MSIAVSLLGLAIAIGIVAGVAAAFLSAAPRNSGKHRKELNT